MNLRSVAAPDGSELPWLIRWLDDAKRSITARYNIMKRRDLTKEPEALYLVIVYRELLNLEAEVRHFYGLEMRSPAPDWVIEGEQTP